MNLADRRYAMKIAMGLAIAPMLASRTVWAATAGGAFAPPESSMIYQRTLDRHLPGGARLQTHRDFLVRFERVGAGFRMTGNQISARVTAPENLARFARLEEERVERGIFPLMLDRAGHIVDGEDSQLSDEVEAAFRTVELQMGINQAGQADEYDRLVESLHSAGTQMTSHLPADLFAPVEEERQQQREIILPWGDSGEVSTRFEAERDPLTGVMRTACREVVTRLANDERRTVERWQLDHG